MSEPSDNYKDLVSWSEEIKNVHDTLSSWASEWNSIDVQLDKLQDEAPSNLNTLEDNEKKNCRNLRGTAYSYFLLRDDDTSEDSVVEIANIAKTALTDRRTAIENDYLAFKETNNAFSLEATKQELKDTEKTLLIRSVLVAYRELGIELKLKSIGITESKLMEYITSKLEITEDAIKQWTADQLNITIKELNGHLADNSGFTLSDFKQYVETQLNLEEGEFDEYINSQLVTITVIKWLSNELNVGKEKVEEWILGIGFESVDSFISFLALSYNITVAEMNMLLENDTDHTITFDGVVGFIAQQQGTSKENLIQTMSESIAVTSVLDFLTKNLEVTREKVTDFIISDLGFTSVIEFANWICTEYDCTLLEVYNKIQNISDDENETVWNDVKSKLKKSYFNNNDESYNNSIDDLHSKAVIEFINKNTKITYYNIKNWILTSQEIYDFNLGFDTLTEFATWIANRFNMSMSKLNETLETNSYMISWTEFKNVICERINKPTQELDSHLDDLSVGRLVEWLSTETGASMLKIREWIITLGFQSIKDFAEKISSVFGLTIEELITKLDSDTDNTITLDAVIDYLAELNSMTSEEYYALIIDTLVTNSFLNWLSIKIQVSKEQTKNFIYDTYEKTINDVLEYVAEDLDIDIVEINNMIDTKQYLDNFDWDHVKSSMAKLFIITDTEFNNQIDSLVSENLISWVSSNTFVSKEKTLTWLLTFFATDTTAKNIVEWSASKYQLSILEFNQKLEDQEDKIITWDDFCNKLMDKSSLTKEQFKTKLEELYVINLVTFVSYELQITVDNATKWITSENGAKFTDIKAFNSFISKILDVDDTEIDALLDETNKENFDTYWESIEPEIIQKLNLTQNSYNTLISNWQTELFEKWISETKGITHKQMPDFIEAVYFESLKEFTIYIIQKYSITILDLNNNLAHKDNSNLELKWGSGTEDKSIIKYLIDDYIMKNEITFNERVNGVVTFLFIDFLSKNLDLTHDQCIEWIENTSYFHDSSKLNVTSIKDLLDKFASYCDMTILEVNTSIEINDGNITLNKFKRFLALKCQQSIQDVDEWIDTTIDVILNPPE